MEYLIIYDLTGKIFWQQGGAHVDDPVGVPYMRVDVPEGKYLTKIDTTSDVHIPVYESYPKSEVTSLMEQVEALNIAFAEIMGV